MSAEPFTFATLHVPLIQKYIFVVAVPTSLEETVAEVIKTEMKPLFGGMELSDFNNEFLNKHKFSLPHLLSGEFAFVFCSDRDINNHFACHKSLVDIFM